MSPSTRADDHGTAPDVDIVRPSRLGRLGIRLLALVLYVLLIDAAVETYQSRSPVGLWVAAPVALYVSFSVWLMLQGRQTGPGAKTSIWVSLFLFLAILAATAMQPDGLTRGVLVAGYPTSTVMSVSTIAVILLAMVSLVVDSPLPAAARLVTGLAGCYGIAAFGTGLAWHRSYLQLLQGQSVWERLPYWLQGAFIGSLVVVPIAVAVEVGLAMARVKLRGRRHRIVYLALGAAIAYGAFSAEPSSGHTQRLLPDPAETAALRSAPTHATPPPRSTPATRTHAG